MSFKKPLSIKKKKMRTIRGLFLAFALGMMGCAGTPTQSICNRPHVQPTHYATVQQVQSALNDKSKDRVVFLLFGADWCKPCLKLKSLLKQGDSFNKALHLNTDETWAFVLSRRLGVQGLPTLVVFKGGQPVEMITDLNKIVMKLLIH